MRLLILLIPVFSMLFMFPGCNENEPDPGPLSILSITINGGNLDNGDMNVPVMAELTITFSASLIPGEFESALSLKSGSVSPDYQVSYSNQTSKAIINAQLEYGTQYELRISAGSLGQNGQYLEQDRTLVFTTSEDNTIYSMSPCTTASSNCLRSVEIVGDGSGNFSFYSSFPIYEDLAKWVDLEAAIIVIHGVSRDADHYFTYLMSALKSLGLEDKVLLISPYFKVQSEANPGELYWNGADWREGQNSISNGNISSFAVVDQLIQQLGDETHFPALKKILVTGHSSGALFAHLYAGANQVESALPNISFDYIVANSQYFFYPDGRRIDENSGQLFIPSTCGGYDLWPLGYSATPPFVQALPQEVFTNRFVDRSIHYLLGNGTGSDGTLNTNDCYATLLGSSRYQRGENMFRYMELVYPGQHHHQKTIVEGIGHDGSAMYNSAEFKTLLSEIIK